MMLPNEPAFPVYLRVQGMEHREIKDAVGMALRDYFAAKAMQGLMAWDHVESFNEIARESYRLADAMLKERAK